MGIFVAMNARIPVRSLVRVNWLMAIFISLLSSIFIFVYLGYDSYSFYRPILVTVEMILPGFVNIVILRVLYKTENRAFTGRGRIYRYLLGFLFTFVILTFTRLISNHFVITQRIVLTPIRLVVLLVVKTIVINTLNILTQDFILLQDKKNRTELENSQLKTANMEAVNLLLKQQIHPHFLFNALSTLKTLYKTDADAGESYLIHLADFLRAAVSGEKNKLARLSDEIKLCEDYLGMQRIRFGRALECVINIPDTVLTHGFVPPFSIQPLLENAIKHNEITDESPLVIRIYCENGYIVIANNLQLKRYVDLPSGEGLSSLTERYRILSGDEVIIRDEEGIFSVRIKVLKQ
ncbi:MAG: histidine kinase [Puia sp.]|nr:histidine kinase [Puia sp.]